MTYNQIITLFRGIASASKYIHTFGTGELWEIDGIIKPGIKYPLLWCEPLSSEIQEQIQIRTFRFICMDVVNKDKSNEQEVLSDTELGLEDLIKVLRMESDDYTLINNPTLEPFKEEFGDWCAGWRAEFQIELNFNSNDCDISSEDLAALVLNSDGDVLAYLSMGDTYTVVSPVNSVNGQTGTVVLDYSDFGQTIVNTSISYNVLISDYTINVTSNSVTVTLLTAIGNDGKVFNIKNSGSGIVTINTTLGQTIDGVASGAITLNQYDNLTVQSDGTNWIIL